MLEADLLKRTMNDAPIIDSAAMMGKDAEACFAFVLYGISLNEDAASR